MVVVGGRRVRLDQRTVEVSGHLCECGCGEFTMVAPRTISSRGVVKGQPRRFIFGHGMRGSSPARPVREPKFRLLIVKVRGCRRCGCGCGQRRSSKKARFAAGHAPTRIKPAVVDRWVVEDRGFETPCWIWPGGTNSHGYGRMRRGGRELLVHRISYQHRVGPIPDGYELHHRCEQKLCVNPEHLEPLTPEQHGQLHGEVWRRAA